VSDSFRVPGDQRGGNISSPINPFDFNSDLGNSGLDRRHVFTSNVIYDLPFGRGKTWGHDWSRPMDVALGGWQTNMIFSGQSGTPFSVSSNGTVASLTGDPFANVPAHLYLNKAAFTSVGPGNPGTTCVNNLAGNAVCFGNTRRNEFYGPGFFRTDFSLFKNMAFTERWRGQAGIEFFNVLNHNNPLIPSNDIGNGDFGKFNNALPPRTVQYRFKLLF